MTTPRTAVTGKFLPFWGTNHQRISRPQAEEFRAASVAAAAVVPALMAAAADAGDGANSGDKPPAHAVTAPPQSEEGACQQSHTPHGWAPARVAHERTGFVLRDRHTGLFCADCHKSDFTVSLSTACASCHQDVQVRELGTQCQGCHTEASFA